MSPLPAAALYKRHTPDGPLLTVSVTWQGILLA